MTKPSGTPIAKTISEITVYPQFSRIGCTINNVSDCLCEDEKGRMCFVSKEAKARAVKRIAMQESRHRMTSEEKSRKRHEYRVRRGLGI